MTRPLLSLMLLLAPLLVLVSYIVAIAQGGYAIAPAVFGLIRELSPQTDFAPGAAAAVFAAAALVQCLAIGAFLAGRRY